ncbi:MAG: DDE-type integrase/transposase/recombinase [Thermoplasmata archaeon]
MGTEVFKAHRKFVGKQKPEIKVNVHVDEVLVKVKGKNKYYWGAKDKDTKFKLAKKLTHKRDKFGAKTYSENSDTTAQEGRRKLSPIDWASINEHTTNTSTTQTQNSFMEYPSPAKDMA